MQILGIITPILRYMLLLSKAFKDLLGNEETGSRELKTPHTYKICTQDGSTVVEIDYRKPGSTRFSDSYA